MSMLKERETKLLVPLSSQLPCSISLSIGVANCIHAHTPLNALLSGECADEMMCMPSNRIVDESHCHVAVCSVDC